MRHYFPPVPSRYRIVHRGGQTISQRFATRQWPGTRGLTLVECLLALVVLAIAVLGITIATGAGHQHLSHGDQVLRAVRVAEHLMEEIQSRPYAGHGSDRASFHLDDYNGFNEPAGSLRDVLGDLYPSADQQFSRAVTVTDTIHTLTSLDGASVSGKTVVITLEDSKGNTRTLSRFIPERVP